MRWADLWSQNASQRRFDMRILRHGYDRALAADHAAADSAADRAAADSAAGSAIDSSAAGSAADSSAADSAADGNAAGAACEASFARLAGAAEAVARPVLDAAGLRCIREAPTLPAARPALCEPSRTCLGPVSDLSRTCLGPV